MLRHFDQILENFKAYLRPLHRDSLLFLNMSRAPTSNVNCPDFIRNDLFGRASMYLKIQKISQLARNNGHYLKVKWLLKL